MFSLPRNPQRSNISAATGFDLLSAGNEISYVVKIVSLRYPRSGNEVAKMLIGSLLRIVRYLSIDTLYTFMYAQQ